MPPCAAFLYVNDTCASPSFSLQRQQSGKINEKPGPCSSIAPVQDSKLGGALSVQTDENIVGSAHLIDILAPFKGYCGIPETDPAAVIACGHPESHCDALCQEDEIGDRAASGLPSTAPPRTRTRASSGLRGFFNFLISPISFYDLNAKIELKKLYNGKKSLSTAMKRI